MNRWLHAALAAALVAAGCASAPPTRFHTLLPAPAATSRSATSVPAGWELLPVGIPVQVAQPQLVVRRADDTLAMLEHERWIAPLADELRAAIAERLARAPASASSPRTRIAVDVTRFESAPGRYARIEADWALRPSAGGGDALRCRGVFEQAVGAGLPALSAGHRAAVVELGDAIAATLAAGSCAGR
jgi:uncharacterized lipoprotein YmbA